MFQEMFQKSILEKCCAVVKRYWWHMDKNIIMRKLLCHKTGNINSKFLKRNKLKLTDIRGLWKKSKYWEENMQTDTVTVNFAPVSLSSQSKKTVLWK